jgi:DNA-directed RNA polymerase subunit M/transcription elongation factor TFIIS
MTKRVKLETVCPNNHNQTLTFTQEQFESALQSDDLMFHCNTCDTDWPPSSEEITKVRKEFAQDGS